MLPQGQDYHSFKMQVMKLVESEMLRVAKLTKNDIKSNNYGYRQKDIKIVDRWHPGILYS